MSDAPNQQVGGGEAAPPELSDAQFADGLEELGLLDDRPKRPQRQPQKAASDPPSEAPARELPGQDPAPGPEDPAPSEEEEDLPDEPEEADEADSDHQGIEPPNSLTREERELWRQLPPEAQQMFARRESDRDKAFTQKTQEIAEHRRALESTFEAVNTERQRYAENLEQLLYVAAPEVQRFRDIDWQRLAQEQPAEYVRMSAERDALRGRIGAIQQQLGVVQQQQQQAAAYQFQERKAEEAQRLVEKIPDFADAEKGPKKIQEMRQYLQRQGFTPQEIGQAVDHRMLVVVDKAMQLERMQATRKQAEAKQNGRAPTVQRPGSARQGSDSRASQRRAQKMEALRQSGSDKDAISYLLEVIDK